MGGTNTVAHDPSAPARHIPGFAREELSRRPERKAWPRYLLAEVHAHAPDHGASQGLWMGMPQPSKSLPLRVTSVEALHTSDQAGGRGADHSEGQRKPGPGLRPDCWGVANLGHEISDQAVGNVLRRHGLPPAPERKRTSTWAFVRTHVALLGWSGQLFGLRDHAGGRGSNDHDRSSNGPALTRQLGSFPELQQEGRRLPLTRPTACRRRPRCRRQ